MGLGNGVLGLGLQCCLLCVDLLHRCVGLRLVAGQVVGAGVLAQPQVVHQRLVLGQVALDARQLLACVVHVLAQHVDVGTSGLQVLAVQVLFALSCCIHMLLCGL